MDYPGNGLPLLLWVFFEFFEYKHLAEKAVAVLVQMSTTYFCKEVLLKSTKNKQNSILNIHCLMRGGIEKGLTPRYRHIAETMQEQAIHLINFVFYVFFTHLRA